MKDEQIDRIKSAIEAADHIAPAKKQELLDALSRIQPAIAAASQTDHRHAENLGQLVESSTHEATRPDRRSDDLEGLLHQLKESAQKFEASHPDLVSFVTEYTGFLSALGV